MADCQTKRYFCSEQRSVLARSPQKVIKIAEIFLFYNTLVTRIPLSLILPCGPKVVRKTSHCKCLDARRTPGMHSHNTIPNELSFDFPEAKKQLKGLVRRPTPQSPEGAERK